MHHTFLLFQPGRVVIKHRDEQGRRKARNAGFVLVSRFAHSLIRSATLCKDPVLLVTERGLHCATASFRTTSNKDFCVIFGRLRKEVVRDQLGRASAARPV